MNSLKSGEGNHIYREIYWYRSMIFKKKSITKTNL
ncbi:hypothetical protein QE439_000676 [Pedobacter agri]|nr:hypothetical protein [Pedobacter agri]